MYCRRDVKEPLICRASAIIAADGEQSNEMQVFGILELNTKDAERVLIAHVAQCLGGTLYFHIDKNSSRQYGTYPNPQSMSRSGVETFEQVQARGIS